MVNKIDYEKLNNVQCYCQWATFKAIPGALGTEGGGAWPGARPRARV